MINDIMDLHTHTLASGHAYNTLYEMVHSAAAKGVKLLGVTEHAPKIPGACHPFYFINFKVVPRELSGIRLMLGCELNILDYQGTIDLKERYLKGLDYAIASIHEPCYTCGTVSQNTRWIMRPWCAGPGSTMCFWRSMPAPCIRLPAGRTPGRIISGCWSFAAGTGFL